MKVSGNHHYVPKAILRNFCFSGSSTYYKSRNSKTSNIESRNIDSIFRRRHYNTFKQGGGKRTDALEIFFAHEFDDYIPSWVELFNQAIKTGAIRFRTDKDRFRFIQFFFNHTKRSPDFIEPIVRTAAEETFHPGFIAELEQKLRPLTGEEKARLSRADIQQDIINNSRVMNMSIQTEKILETLASLKIFIATPARVSKQFIVGSNPVVRFASYPKQHLGEQGVELWTTLTPKIAVGFACNGDAGDLVLLGDDQVRKINSRLAVQSSAVASRSVALISSLTRAHW